MYKKIIIRLFSVILFAGISSCNQTSDLSEYGETFEKIILSKDGSFRSINIGESIEAVKAKETGNLVEEDTDYLHYDVELNKTDYYNITYYFDGSGLYETMFDATFDKKSSAEELFKNFSAFYSNQYGEPKNEEGFHIWETSSAASKKIEIALSNNSGGTENGYISLIISNYDY
ncbi:MAG: hypothetical protein H0V01_06900 [Bacteroidetes bacterium]|nr:hypothetical protein [Bacteroidota bacterium]HET6244451.1 hypothetical protein [Bacteroidia bacterium]